MKRNLRKISDMEVLSAGRFRKRISSPEIVTNAYSVIGAQYARSVVMVANFISPSFPKVVLKVAISNLCCYLSPHDVTHWELSLWPTDENIGSITDVTDSVMTRLGSIGPQLTLITKSLRLTL